MHKRLCLIFIAPMLITFSPAAGAWSASGHTIVCEIAYQALTASARNEVDRLIGLDPAYSNYAGSCYYPDTVDDGRRAEHYVNFPRNTESITDTDCPSATHCVFSAIQKEIRAIKKHNDDLVRLAAIKYLGHWIGDLHQPLHTSFADDRGGNDIIATGRCRGNLHSVWDRCIIQQRLLQNPSRANITRFARAALDRTSSVSATQKFAATTGANHIC